MHDLNKMSLTGLETKQLELFPKNEFSDLDPKTCLFSLYDECGDSMAVGRVISTLNPDEMYVFIFIFDNYYHAVLDTKKQTVILDPPYDENFCYTTFCYAPSL